MPNIDFAELNREIERRGAGWKAVPTTVSMLSEGDFSNLLGVVVDRADVEAANAEARERVADIGVGAPPAFDWRNVGGRNFVTSVKDQRDCGSCVSFGACACVESAVAIKNPGTIVDLSEADLHFCSSHGANCGGWWPSKALEAVKSRGVADDACFPYFTAFDASKPPKPSCKACTDRDDRAYKITGYT